MITRPVSAARWIALDTSEHYVTVTLAPGSQARWVAGQGLCHSPCATQPSLDSWIIDSPKQDGHYPMCKSGNSITLGNVKHGAVQTILRDNRDYVR